MPGSELRAFVIRFPCGRFQGQPKQVGSRKLYPKVEFDRTRIYATETAARRSIAHKGGTVLPVAVVLLEPSAK